MDPLGTFAQMAAPQPLSPYYYSPLNRIYASPIDAQVAQSPYRVGNATAIDPVSPGVQVSGDRGFDALNGVTDSQRAHRQAMTDFATMAAMGFAAPIKAYHGSPFTFDRFDISKIGTGEGAQAFGHGLYFAGNENVAKSYRDALSSPQMVFDAINHAVKEQRLGGPPVADTLSGWAADPQMVDGIRRVASDPKVQELAGKIARTDDFSQAEIDAYKALDSHMKNILPKGSMYEVNLHVDPQQLLDWDKPISQQPAQVQQGVYDAYTSRRIPASVANHVVDNYTGNNALLNLNSPPYGWPGYGVNDPAAASAALQKSGIPGIQYLDQGSRAAGEGSRNYVMFSDSPIEILRRYGLAGLTAGGAGALANGAGSPAAVPPPTTAQ